MTARRVTKLFELDFLYILIFWDKMEEDPLLIRGISPANKS